MDRIYQTVRRVGVLYVERTAPLLYCMVYVMVWTYFAIRRSPAVCDTTVVIVDK